MVKNSPHGKVLLINIHKVLQNQNNKFLKLFNIYHYALNIKSEVFLIF